MQAPAQLAQHILDEVFKLLIRHPQIYGPIIAVPIGVAARWVRKWRRQAKERANARAVRGWLTVTAAVDVVSISEHNISDKKHYYLAVLTYFYRRPDLQMGDYEREFTSKAAAQEWVKQFKGRSVMVHVNPNNSADSFLLRAIWRGWRRISQPVLE